MKVVSQEQIARIDREFMLKSKISEKDLINRTGQMCADVISSELKAGKKDRFVFCCGSGNNGADAIDTAIFLWQKGFRNLSLVLAVPLKKLKPVSFELFKHLKKNTKIKIFQTDIKGVDLNLNAVMQNVDWIVDGLLGTGLDRPLKGISAELIKLMNTSKAVKVSIDIPSGLMTDSFQLPNIVVKADVTITIGRPKICLLMDPGRTAVGRLIIKNIGFPESQLDNPQIKIEYYTDMDAIQDIPPRPEQAYKNYFGHLAVWAGSPGKSGAAILSTLAALRTGAGLVTLCSEKDVCCCMHDHIPEAMSKPLDLQDLDKGADTICKIAKESEVLLAGPGIGTQEQVKVLLKKLAGIYNGILIADADCINCMADDPSLIKAFEGRLVLTPHIGEISRLLGKKYESLTNELLDDVRVFAKEKKAYIVLKSSNTVIVDPLGDRIWINSTGNSGLAKAGSGDVLAGILASLIVQEKALSQKIERDFSIIRALRFGVWLHGKAADLAVKTINKRSLLATDTIEAISEAYNSIKN